MRKLFLLLLFSLPAFSQTQIPPVMIQPGAPNTCLTTSSLGQTVWGSCGGGSGYQIIQSAGIAIAQRNTLNFLGALSCVDDGANGRTSCSLQSPLSVPNGGTGLTILVAHQLYVGNNTGTPTAIPVGINGQVLESGGPGVDPSFQDPVVSGPDSPGTAPTKPPVQVGTFDGTNVQRLNSDTSGRLNVNVTNTPSVTISGTPSVINTPPANQSVNLTQLVGNALGAPSNYGTSPGAVAVQGVNAFITNTPSVTISGTPAVTNTPPANQSVNETQVAGATLGAPSNYGTSPGAVVVPGVNAFITNTPSVNNTPPANQSVNETQVAGVALGAPSNYGTSPGAVAVPGVNAFITNTPSVTISGTPAVTNTPPANQSVNHTQTAGSALGAITTYGTSPGAVNVESVNAFITNTPTVTANAGTGTFNTNCVSGCSSAGDQTTGSTALGSNGATISVPLAGERGAAFQLQSGGTGVYTVTPQCSFDGGTLYNVNGWIQDPVAGTFSSTATISSAQVTTDYQVICPAGSSHAQMKVTAYTSGTANWLARSTVNIWQGLTLPVAASGTTSYSAGQVGTPVLNTDGSSYATVATSANGDGGLQSAANERDGTRVKVTAALRLRDTSQSTGAQLVAAPGDATNGLFVQDKANNLTALAGTTLGAPSNYGTSPGAVEVIGVNAFITNTVPVTLTSTTITNTVSVAGVKTNNNAAPGATNEGVLPGIANAATQTWTEGDQVLESMDLSGRQRVRGTISDNGAAATSDLEGAAPGIYQTSYLNGTAATQGRNAAVSVGTEGLLWTAQLPAIRPASFTASKKFAASSTTDNAVMPGNASNTVLLTKIIITCTQTTAGTLNIEVLKRSAADTSGTSAAMTAVPDDSNYSAAVSAPLSYTGTGPSVGAAVGDIDNAQIGCNATGTAGPNDVYIYNLQQKPIVLRGTAQQVAINLGGAVTGGNITVTFKWIETATITP